MAFEGHNVWVIVLLVIVALLAVLPVVIWIGAMIWAAQRDGADEDEFRRTHPPS